MTMIFILLALVEEGRSYRFPSGNAIPSGLQQQRTRVRNLRLGHDVEMQNLDAIVHQKVIGISPLLRVLRGAGAGTTARGDQIFIAGQVSFPFSAATDEKALPSGEGRALD
jgi:hypothetical protein